MMLNFLLVLLIGPPAVLATVIIAGIGLWKSNYRLIFGASMLSFPFSWYLSGFPAVQSPVFLLPLLLLLSSYLMFRGREMLAWLAAIPFFLVILLLYYIASAQ